ncbi:MAG: hypothetical protein PHE97_07540, partial [Candidatus Omnitrophica bacterium]|nr:hypothetical protein [Candidatus Omnitrophota bacterium]
NQLTNCLNHDMAQKKYLGRDKFFALKKLLINRRFPLTKANNTLKESDIFFSKLKQPLDNNWQVKKTFIPEAVFVEKEVRKSFVVDNFKKAFPSAKTTVINSYGQHLKENKFTLAELKKPIVFIIKEKWDFLKPCPCTKSHLRCGYWILNLGFGCPYDCSYCFLQQYSNFPGLILPGNLDDFFDKFDSFAKKLKQPIRLGTGEFCDSLALDNITGYSKKLIPYFSKKNVLFELKTKSTSIESILKIPAPPNIIISWSLNPSKIAETEELGAATLGERLAAARKVQDSGYLCGFHFDPIIHTSGWETLYKETVKMLYESLEPPFAWISLGTLRGSRNLKTISEMRFPKGKIFYGELLLGEDKKLRYPEFLRKEVYAKMLRWIRKYDQKTPLYLCMESKSVWETIDKNLDSTSKIEKYLINR